MVALKCERCDRTGVSSGIEEPRAEIAMVEE